MTKPMPEGLDPYLAPYGGWKLISISTNRENYDLNLDYRCVSCRAVHPKATDVCPSCGKYMKYRGGKDESD